MATYIVKMRRGTAKQWVNSSIVPEEGELVVEIDEINHLHKLKIGDGIHLYKDLAYLMAGDEVVSQVLAQALPRVVTVNLDVDKWELVTLATDPNIGYYKQEVSLEGITERSRLDLQPDADMLAEFQKLDLAFVTENKGGVITVYSVGDMPLKSYPMQATITETEVVIESDKIVGVPVGTPTMKEVVRVDLEIDWETGAVIKPTIDDFLNLSERYINGEITLVASLDGSAAVVSGIQNYTDFIMWTAFTAYPSNWGYTTIYVFNLVYVRANEEIGEVERIEFTQSEVNNYTLPDLSLDRNMDKLIGMKLIDNHPEYISVDLEEELGTIGVAKKDYVDDKIAELLARIEALEGK